MSAWDGAAAPDPPPMTGAARVRLVWRAGAAAAWTAGLFALYLGLRGVDGWARAIALRPLRGLAPWVVRLWAAGALALLGLRLRVAGTPMRHAGALVANHASWIDIVALDRASAVFFVSKAEVAGWPVIGAIGRAIGTIFIDRRPVEARRQAAVLAARLAQGDRLVIFPEGTSTDGRRVLPFKSALFGVFLTPALRDRLWVQPVSIVYRPARGLDPAFYGWWGDTDFGAHLMAVLAHSRGGRVELRFHAPLRASDHPDRKALAEAAEAAVRRGWAALAGASGGDAGNGLQPPDQRGVFTREQRSSH